MKKLLLLLLSLSTIAAYGMDNQQEIIEPILPQLQPVDDFPADHLALPEPAPRQRREETPQEKLNMKLHDACFAGNLDEVQHALAEGAELESKHRFCLSELDTDTAIYFAAKKGHDHIVQYLLKQGAKFEAKAIIEEAKDSGSTELARYFITMSDSSKIAKEVASIDKTMLEICRDDENPYFRRGFSEEGDSISKILNHITVKNVLMRELPLKDKILRNTKILRTAILSNTTLPPDLQEAMAEQAEIEELLKSELTQLFLKYIKRERYCAEYFQKQIIALLQADISINTINKDGKTALWLAVEKNNPQLVEFLLSQPGVDANPKHAFSGRTLLQMMKMMPAGKE
jgi:hypothetical protein